MPFTTAKSHQQFCDVTNLDWSPATSLPAPMHLSTFTVTSHFLATSLSRATDFLFWRKKAEKNGIDILKRNSLNLNCQELSTLLLLFLWNIVKLLVCLVVCALFWHSAAFSATYIHDRGNLLGQNKQACAIIWQFSLNFSYFQEFSNHFAYFPGKIC